MSTYYIGVVDVGKTNKKVVIYDANLNKVDSAFKNIPEQEAGGLLYEDLDNMAQWFTNQFAEFAKRYPIKAISVTTHGAFAAAIDPMGALAIPPLAYTSDAGEDFRKEFFAKFGDPIQLKKETATTEIGSLVNLGKLIYFWQKKWPEKWDSIWKVLLMPQYFGFLFTGRIGAEPTSIGCHTYLYDPKTKNYSRLVSEMGLTPLLPEKIQKSWEVLGPISPVFQKSTGLPQDCLVTMGIHDSNSSLLPYLVKNFENFVLNSTGTWCVAMHPTSSATFRPDELDALVFYNFDVYQNPVKTSIFKGGAEYEFYTGILNEIHGEIANNSYDQPLYQEIIAQKSLFVLPSLDKGTGIFPDAEPGIMEAENFISADSLIKGKYPDFFKDYKKALAVVNISLAVQTSYALTMAGFNGKGAIFIEGGFRKNEPYLHVLGAIFPKAQICLSEIEEATSFGAAILARTAIDGEEPKDSAELFDIDIIRLKTLTIPGMKEYMLEFDRLVKS